MNSFFIGSLLNGLKGRWPQFRQECISIVYLSCVHVWWSFNFPAYVRLGTSWSAILGVIASIGATFLTLYIFLFPEKHPPYLNFVDVAPSMRLFTNILRACNVALFHAMAFFVWYNDLYGMSNFYYCLCYAHFYISFVLMHRAVQRYKYKISNDAC